MSSHSTPSAFRMLSVLAAATLLVAVVLILGAGRSSAMSRTHSDIFCKVRIINFDHSVARFDTSTGAIHRFNGNLDNPGSRASWITHVKGVAGKTSGYLEIQHAGGATFLVDCKSGSTWILHPRGSSYTWDEIKILR